MNTETAKLMKISHYSYGVVVPKNFVKKLKWREKQKVKIKIKNRTITISELKRRK